MAFTVTVRPVGRTLGVGTGSTILETALAAGIDYPHGCRAGNCGACKSRLHEGAVDLLPHSEFALSGEEREAGLILACRAVPGSDCEVAWLDQDEQVAHPVRHLACRVASLHDLTHDIKRVRLAVETGGPFDFSPGQFARVTFAGHAPRDYSMASQPGDSEIELHVRAVSGGGASRHVHGGLAVGDHVRVEGPYGISFLRERHGGPILALAGGSGMAPIKSIVDRALAVGRQQDIFLYFGVRDERDLYGEGHFRTLADRHRNLRFIPVLSEPSRPTPYRTGLLADAIRQDFTDLDGCKAYLAGPPPMVESCMETLTRLGVRREDCHADPFYTEAEKAAREVAR